MDLKVLVITISIGKKYQKIYEEYFLDNHKKFCKTLGFDFKNIKTFLDKETSSEGLTSAQKLLICNLDNTESYDFLIFLDCDILVNIKNAKKYINELFQSPNKIMIVDEYNQLGYENRLKINKKQGWESSATEYYKNFGYSIETKKVLNSGFFVLNSKNQKKFMAETYLIIKSNFEKHSNFFHFEQSTFGYNLLKKNNYISLENKWNYLVSVYELFNRKNLIFRFFNNKKKRLNSIYNENIMIHFAGGAYKNYSKSLLKRITT